LKKVFLDNEDAWTPAGFVVVDQEVVAVVFKVGYEKV